MAPGLVDDKHVTQGAFESSGRSQAVHLDLTKNGCCVTAWKWLDAVTGMCYCNGMSRPLRKGPPLTFRLSLEASQELDRRAAKAGVTPREHLVEQLERSLSPISVVEAKSTAPAAPPLPGERVFGRHPGWRLSCIGMNICVACGEPKMGGKEECPGTSE